MAQSIIGRPGMDTILPGWEMRLLSDCDELEQSRNENQTKVFNRDISVADFVEESTHEHHEERTCSG